MSDQPLVSIITPSYNQTAYLESCMRSVLEQNYARVEYFVVDGDSTDGSVEIIERLADQYSKRLKWWISEKDLGQANAINKGFRKASGDIIAWLNSDDLYMENAFQKIADYFRENPNIGLVFSDVISINAQNEIINIMRYKQWGLKDLMAFNIIGQPGVFMRRSALEAAGFLDTDYHMLLDHHLWLRIALKFEIGYLNGCLAAARFHPQAKNVAQAALFSREAYQLLEWMQISPDMSREFNKNKRMITAGAHCFSARYLLDAGMGKEAVKDYFLCLRNHPPTALKTFHRLAYALVSLVFPLEWLKKIFLDIKKTKAVYNDASVIKEWWTDAE